MSDSARPMKRATLPLTPGFYVAFNCDQGGVFPFMVRLNVIDTDGTQALCAWGLSMYRRQIGYRTLGVVLDEWLAAPGNNKIAIYKDRDWTRSAP